MNEDSKVEIVFAPGCFDNFEGTQEELNEFIAELNRLAETGELFEQSRPVDLDNLSEEDADLIEHLKITSDTPTRNLQ
jgi:NTP pyrophosphatase (non-canonical NTP hydrolase)